VEAVPAVIVMRILLARLLYGSPSAERVELPNPETHQIAWWFGMLFMGGGFVFGVLGLVAGLWQGQTFPVVVGAIFVLLFGPLSAYVQSRSVDNLVFDFADEVFATHERSIPFEELERVEMEPYYKSAGDSGYWTWRASLEEEGRGEIDLGTGTFERLYAILRRLTDYDVVFDIPESVALAPGFESNRSVGLEDGVDATAIEGVEMDGVSGADAGIEWSYTPPVRFPLMVGLAMASVVVVAAYLKMPEARELFALMSWTGYLVTTGVLLALAAGFALALGMTRQMYHRTGSHQIARSGVGVEYVSNLGGTVEWKTDDAEMLVQMDGEPWTGVIVAGDGLALRLPAGDRAATTIRTVLAEMHVGGWDTARNR